MPLFWMPQPFIPRAAARAGIADALGPSGCWTPRSGTGRSSTCATAPWRWEPPWKAASTTALGLPGCSSTPASTLSPAFSTAVTAASYAVILDATAFYPEGGGQAGDTGCLGSVRVLDTQERDGEVIHLCDGPLEVGAAVEGCIDYGPRFARMQQHSGEHIVSGILHSRYGCHNTGFHMGADVTTIDFDCVIPAEDLPELEALANQAVWADLPVKCWIPTPQELENVTYRTKRALLWPVRIVEIPGCDHHRL